MKERNENDWVNWWNELGEHGIVLSDERIPDERTRNFLSLSGSVIRKMLREFPGAVISISRDRKYLEEFCNKVYELSDKGLNLSVYDNYN